MNDTLILPRYFIIEPTNVCNYRCPICPNRFFAPNEKGSMEWGLFESLIDQIKGAAHVIQLYWMGEPILHPQLSDMIKLCKAKTTAKVMLSTNGALMTSAVADRLLDSGIDEIIVSLDAAENQDIYGIVRTGGLLSAVNTKVEYLLSANKGRANIVLQFIDMYINRSEQTKFKARWSRPDCSVSIQCLYTWSNQIPALNLASDNLSPVAKKPRVACADLWHKMSIHWDGKISVCCFDWNSTVTIGNATKHNLVDVWNGDAISALRDAHKSRQYNCNSLCNECDAWAEPDEYVALFNLGQSNDVEDANV
ncbi:radical SAM protein [Planctomycetales bacterium]|nr:radical SAM protein [Planctomycetales bacterium]GHS97379.1 radical SAM protein [Planctomycetales bacterium]GHT03538.1 radical SAM protein [Planctomycetales bacterium]